MIPCQRQNFDIPENIAYLNCAYMGPLSHRVAAAAEKGVAGKAHPWETTPEHFFTDSEIARSLFAKLIGTSANDIAIVPSASYGIATAARNIRITKGQSILCLQDQFPSNVYSWKEMAKEAEAQVRFIKKADAAQKSGQIDWTGALLDAMDHKTAIVALPHCHWTDGSLIDLEVIGEKARELGAALVLDITQSGGAMPINIAKVDPDFLVCATYKWLLGPYASGFLYVAPRHQTGQPIEHNWLNRKSSEDFAGLVNYQDQYQPGARRFDMGERAGFQTMPMNIAALEQCLEWGVENIAETLAATTADIAARAAELGYTSVPAEFRAGHFLGLDMTGGDPDAVLTACKAKEVYVSVRGTSVRVTPHLYNTEEDVDRFMQVLAGAKVS